MCLALPTSVLGAKEGCKTEAQQLRREVDALMKRLDKLEGHHRGGAPEIHITQGQRNVKSPAEGKLKVTLSGQANKAVAYFDNGTRSSVQTVDNDISSSRIDLKAEATNLDGPFEDWAFGAEYQAEMLDNSTRTATIRGNATTTQVAQAPTTRIFEWYTTYKPWRTQLEVGRGYMSSYFTQNYADMISSSYIGTDGAKGIADIANSIQFWDKTSNQLSVNTSGSLGNNTTPGGICIGNVFDAADGLFRKNRVRLNIGPWSGFTLSASHEFEQTDNADVALRYAGEFNNWLFAGAVAYCENHAVSVTQPGVVVNAFTSYRQWNGSIGFLSPWGVSAMYATADRTWEWPGAKDGHINYAKLGYEAWMNELGKTAFAIYAMEAKNMFFMFTQPGLVQPPAGTNLLQLNNKGQAYGATYVQHLDRVATDLYVIWTNYKYKQTGAGAHRFKKINVGLIGARVKF
jgi:hypothetical protein